MIQRCLFLDPGVLLNLCIIEEGAEVLAALPYRTLVTPAMRDTTYTVERNGETTLHAVEPLISLGVLGIADLYELSASERFIELACLGLRGTLAELAVLASMHGGIMATDDPATIELMTSLLPEVPLLTTAALIHEYAGLAKLPGSQIAHIVTKLQEEAVFTPNKRDPLLDWWNDHTR